MHMHDMTFKQKYRLNNFQTNKVNLWLYLSVLDSWGKFPSGVLWGNLVELGSFDECLLTEHTIENQPPKEIIRGQYCLASLPFWELFHNIYPELSPGLQLKIGICIPRACAAFEANEVLNEILLRVFNITSPSVIVTEGQCTKSMQTKFDIMDWIAM